jgi:hypothetical protein
MHDLDCDSHTGVVGRRVSIVARVALAIRMKTWGGYGNRGNEGSIMNGIAPPRTASATT